MAAHPISIYSLERDKVYYVSHQGGPRAAVKIIADMNEFNGAAGGVIAVFSYQPYRAAFIKEHDPEYRFFTSAGPKVFHAPTPHPSPRRSSSARRSSERRRAARGRSARRSTVRRTKSAPRRQ
jgi:hypothetical protein